MASVAKGLSVEADEERKLVGSFKLSSGSPRQMGPIGRRGFDPTEF
jgi:hypothetical protein